jgi:hypothetical protein
MFAISGWLAHLQTEEYLRDPEQRLGATPDYRRER